MESPEKREDKAVETEIWQRILMLLGRELSDVALDTWFSECKIVELTPGELILHTPSSFKRDIIENKYLTSIKEALRGLLPGEYAVLVLDDDGLESHISMQYEHPGDSEYTFDRFVVGNSNKFAQAAALAVATGRAGRDYNPLFIYGESGLGKTHLLHAIRHTVQHEHADYKIVYVKGDDFTNDLVRALQAGRNMEFREKYRYANLLLVDDIQFIAGKQQTQEEFFHTFNTLYEAGRQIVLTSDRPPREIARLEDRLQTRFESGLLADISPPDYETRMAIIKNKAKELGFSLPEDVAVYIAENMSANIYGDLGISVAEASRQIKDMLRENERAITADIIVEETSKFFMLSPDELRGPRRTKGTVQARHISWYLIRTMTPLSLTDIGGLFSRDHTTVLNGLRNIEKEVRAGTDIAQAVKDISSNIQIRVESRETARTVIQKK